MNRKDKLTIKIDADLLKKYRYICDYYDAILDDQLSFTLRQYVTTFEEIHGPIEISSKDKTNSKNN